MAHGSFHRLPAGTLADEAVRVILAAGAAGRAPLRAALEREGLAVIAECDTLPEAATAMVRSRARACVLDAALPGDRAWAIRTIRAGLPAAVVVLYAAHASDDEITDALGAGAAGYLSGPRAAEGAAHAISLALSGHAAVPAATAAMLSRRARWLRPQALPAAGADLSPREREVLEALLDGATTAQIAAALGLSAVTVRRHVSGVLRKLGGSSREALLLAGHGDAPAPAPAVLSERELQVLRLAAGGASNQAIAGELFITPSTVKNHLTRIMGKLGARNRTEAAVLAARQGAL
jgi:DNA-binding NarL/FixJ family response regulator